MTDNHLYGVAPPPVRREVAALSRHYSGVRYAPDERAVILEVDLDEGWTPRVISMRIKLPDGYPRSPPTVVFPGELRYNGSVPRHLLTSGQYLVRGQLGDPIIYYPVWSEASTLADVVEEVLADLAAVGEPAVREGCDV